MDQSEAGRDVCARGLNLERRLASMLLVTGATGFVGRALAARLLKEGVDTRVAVRGRSAALKGLEQTVVPDLSAMTNWSDALSGVDVVIHAAARVHVMRENAKDPLAEFRKVNLDGTVRLARQAAALGVKRFVFISSIKVNGEATLPGVPFTERDSPAPADPYGTSKYEAELALMTLAAATGMEVVIIRPVLVYGPGVKGNFRSMLRWVARGLPLPFGAVRNKRSFVALENLVDLTMLCVRHPAAAGEVFLVSDGEDLSTRELLSRAGLALGRPARLVPVPEQVLRGAAAIGGRTAAVQRLLGSLQVDISKATSLLDWRPPVTVDEGLRAAVAEDCLFDYGSNRLQTR